MVAPHAQLDTPYAEDRTGAFLTNSALDISMEPSFHQSPSKGRNDLISQMPKTRRGSMRTPRSRIPFADRRNAPGQAEFTPLMKSVTRTNHERRQGKENVGPATPAALKKGLDSIAGSPSLPLPQGGDSMYGADEASSFAHNDSAGTPIANLPSSSVTSTPHPVLGKRGHGGAVIDGGQVMSLREQEHAVSTLEKTNFSLKLKIHFLEEALGRQDPAYNATALKENAELKAPQISMGNELKRCKKALILSERDMELSLQQIAQMKESMKRRHVDESHQEELDRLQRLLEEKDAEIEELRRQNVAAEDKGDDVQQLKDDIADLEAEVREKERLIDDRDEAIDDLKDKIKNGDNAISDLEDQLDSARSRLDQLSEKDAERDEQSHKLQALQAELEKAQARINDLELDVKIQEKKVVEAEAFTTAVVQSKEQIEEELNEIRAEVADKSFHVKGQNRHLEEKIARLQNEVHTLEEERNTHFLQSEDKGRESDQKQQRIVELQREHQLEIQTLNTKIELATHEKEVAMREQRLLNSKLETTAADLARKTEEKDLLRSRHDTLTTESANLQKDLARSQRKVEELEREIEFQKDQDLDNEQRASDKVQEQIEKLKEDYEDLRMSFDQNERQFDEAQEDWEQERRAFLARQEAADEQVASLETEIAKLQELDGTISNREMIMEQALQTERPRHASQEAALLKEIDQLNSDMNARRENLEQSREEAIKLREELRSSKREHSILLEKAQGLEDEIELLQSSLDEDKGLDSRLGSTEAQLSTIRREKQLLQDKVANLNIEIHSLRASLVDVEAQKGDLEAELKLSQQHTRDSLKNDQEKLDLRSAKARLEASLSRVKGEEETFAKKLEAVERELEEEREKAGAEETRMEVEIEDLKRRLAKASEIGQKNLLTAERQVRHLELRAAELEDQLKQRQASPDGASELSLLRNDLSAARQKEANFVERELAQKSDLRRLRMKIADLERNAHLARVTETQNRATEEERLIAELATTKDQLDTAHDQLRQAQKQLRKVEEENQRKMKIREMEIQYTLSDFETSRATLEQDFTQLKNRERFEKDKNETLVRTVQRLERCVERLEKDLNMARSSTGSDPSITIERKDMHKLLRESKLEVEDLRFQLQTREEIVQDLRSQIVTREEAISRHAEQEQHLRKELKRVRDERGAQSQAASTTYKELDRVRRDYDRTVEKMLQLQEAFDGERKALVREVRSLHASTEAVRTAEAARLQLAEKAQSSERSRVAEVREMKRHIAWLKAKAARERRFREDLVVEKQFMQQKIDNYAACNANDVKALQGPGVCRAPSAVERKLRLKSVAQVIIAINRMKRREAEWREHLRVKESLIKQALEKKGKQKGKERVSSRRS